MAASSTAAAFAVALKTALVTRFNGAPWNGTVQVDLVPTADTTTVDRVTLIRAPTGVEGYQQPATMGKRRVDTYRIQGRINTFANDPDTDVAFQASWDRAALILDEVVLQLRDNQTLSGDETQHNLVGEIRYMPAPDERGGWHTLCDYTLEYAQIVS